MNMASCYKIFFQAVKPFLLWPRIGAQQPLAYLARELRRQESRNQSGPSGYYAAGILMAASPGAGDHIGMACRQRLPLRWRSNDG